MKFGLTPEKCAEVAAEYRRLAQRTSDNWIRADLLRSAQFYDGLAPKLDGAQTLARPADSAWEHL